MRRALLVMLAGCSNSADPLPTPSHHDVDSTTISARVVAAAEGGSWLDVSVDATSDRARTLCERIVARELAQLRRIPKLAPAVQAGCATAPLPRYPGHEPILLVTVTTESEGDVELQSIVNGERHQVPPPGDGPKATLTRVVPFADATACDAELKRIAATHAQAQADAQQAVADVLARELKEVIAVQELSCHPDPRRAKDCAQATGSARARCDHQAEELQTDCAKRTAERHMIEARKDVRAAETVQPQGRCATRGAE